MVHCDSTGKQAGKRPVNDYHDVFVAVARLCPAGRVSKTVGQAEF
jgi:hypothetical protein